MGKFEDLTGRKFGRLLVLGRGADYIINKCGWSVEKTLTTP